MTAPRVVVMGVSGSGKTTVGRALADALEAPFLEADAFHSAANVAKMASGRPLDDDDRRPWLAALREAMRAEERVVVACSALRRSYRDELRRAGGVVFVHLEAGRDEVTRRVSERQGHYMKAGMVASQFETLEPPAPDETDVAGVEEHREPQASIAAALEAVGRLVPGTAIAPLLSAGGPDAAVGDAELQALAGRVAAGIDARRVLLVPPDATRLHSRAGELAALLYERLAAAGAEVGVLPALGTHAALTDADAQLLFAGRIPHRALLRHRWREGLARLGEIGAEEVAALSGGRLCEPIPVEVDEQLLDGWDLVVSLGQVVPHEVAGMANFTKNLVVGLGGRETIGRTHWLGALCGMERIMGRPFTPVRDALDAAFDRFVAPLVPVRWLLTVAADTATGVALRGVFAGDGGSGESGGAAYCAAAALSRSSNVTIVPEALARVVCRLDPHEARTTWLGNKAVYRTRMALADGGELVVLAPGVRRFGEDPALDALVRRHGYRGTEATLAAVRDDPALAAEPAAAAHLVHGSPEGRFRVVYCTDPDSGGLGREEVESVGYAWRPLAEELDRLGLAGGEATGPRTDAAGERFLHVANPALGLWTTADRLGSEP